MDRSLLALTLTLVQIQLATAQVVLPPGFNRPTPGATQEQPAAPKPPGEAPLTTPPKLSPTTATGGLNLQNASLVEVIDILARQLKINYILDPRVRGGVTINTYGETKGLDNRTLLDTILRINGAAMIQVGDIYRIVPLADVQRLPLAPEINGKPMPEDERTMLNLVFLKYATVDELAKLLNEFLGENAKMWAYQAANLLIIQDSRRNMKRLMDLISLFDSDTFANQRVRLFEVKNGRPSDLARELEGILKSISLNEKVSPVKFLPVDRINTLIAVAPNPGVFKEVETWLAKLDIAVESSAGTVSNYVYRIKYGFAPTIAMAIMGLYSNNPMAGMGMMMGMYGGGMMGGVGGGMGGGMYGGGMGGGMGGMYGGGMGGGMMGAGMAGMYGAGVGGMYQQPAPMIPSSNATALGVGVPGAADLTGSYLAGQQQGAAAGPRIPRIIPNPVDNTLLIQGSRQEYEQIAKLLRDIDVPPRQVLIEAKIYEVDLTGALSSGVEASLLKLANTNTPPNAIRDLTAGFSGSSFGISIGSLVGRSYELLTTLSALESQSKARVISAPSIIATDSVPASINVGTEVPTLTSQAATGVQQGGTSLFANNIQSRNSGVTLQVMARVNPSGIVTMTINQEVSAPQAPAASAAIQSPSFSKRTVSTQVTVQNGDTIAIGGIINEDSTQSSNGIPFLHRIPVLGAAFGARSYSRSRTELIIFLTPKVIFDMNEVIDATEELRMSMRKLSRYIKE